MSIYRRYIAIKFQPRKLNRLLANIQLNFLNTVIIVHL